MDALQKRKISLEDLFLFDLLASIGSISGVAARTGLTQPAITQKLNRLETELGCLLWVRRGRLIGEPTQAGRRFLQYTHTVLRETSFLLMDLGIMNRRKVIRIASSSIPSEYLLPRLLAEFHDRSDSQEIQMTLAGSRQVCVMVESGEVDVGFSGLVMPGFSGRAVTVSEDRIVPVVSPDSDIARAGKPVTMTELMQLPMIVREAESGTRAVLESALESRGLTIPVTHKIIVVGGMHALLRAVHEGAGFSFVSSFTTADLFVPSLIDFPEIRRGFHMLFRSERLSDIVVKAFADFVKAYFSVDVF